MAYYDEIINLYMGAFTRRIITLDIVQMEIPRTPSSLNVSKSTSCCNRTLTTRCCTFKVKRLTLPFVLSSMALLSPDVQTFYYTPAMVFLSALVLFINFPILVLFTNSRPMYYEDLFVADRNEEFVRISDTAKERFEERFRCVLVVTNALFCAALADYWFYKITSNGDHSYIGMIGTTGGILKIFQLANHCSGSLLLMCTKREVMKRDIELHASIGHHIEELDTPCV